MYPDFLLVLVVTIAVESVQKREEKFIKKRQNQTTYLKAEEFTEKGRSPTAYLKAEKFTEKGRNQTA